MGKAKKRAEPKPRPDYKTNTVIYDGIDVTIPDRLVRKDRLSDEQVATLTSPTVSWAKFRDYSEQPMKPRLPIYVANEAAPVLVTVRDKNGPRTLARYASMKEFEEHHNFADYPASKSISSQEETLIFVGAKPWAAAKEAAAQGGGGPKEPRIKLARDFSEPDAPGKAIARDSSLAKILRLMMRGDKTVEQIVKESGVEGGVVSAEDKVIHRMRFVLFRQHGVGHRVIDGRVSAVLPTGFDKESIFKAPAPK